MDTVGARTATTTHVPATAHTVAHPLPPCMGLLEEVAMDNNSTDSLITAPGSIMAAMVAHPLRGGAGAGATMDVTETRTISLSLDAHSYSVDSDMIN